MKACKFWDPLGIIFSLVSSQTTREVGVLFIQMGFIYKAGVVM